MSLYETELKNRAQSTYQIRYFDSIELKYN
jgi:hypothetical protein